MVPLRAVPSASPSSESRRRPSRSTANRQAGNSHGNLWNVAPNHCPPTSQHLYNCPYSQQLLRRRQSVVEGGRRQPRPPFFIGSKATSLNITTGSSTPFG